MPDAENEIRQLLVAAFTAERERQYTDELAERAQETKRNPTRVWYSTPRQQTPYADYQLAVTEDPATGRFEVAYHTVWWADDLSERLGGFPLFAILGRPELAGRLAGLTVTVDDESGINGTQTWDLHNLLTAPGSFSVLHTLKLPLNEVDTHNGRVVTYDDTYEEGNALGLLLDKCPALLKLAAPSAPGPGFFARETHGLTDLQLQCGLDHQGFVGNLAGSTCFPALTHLEFRDYAETYMDDYPAGCVSFADYLALVSSATLPALRHLTLLDTVLTPEQQAELTQAAAAHGRELRFGELE